VRTCSERQQIRHVRIEIAMLWGSSRTSSSSAVRTAPRFAQVFRTWLFCATELGVGRAVWKGRSEAQLALRCKAKQRVLWRCRNCETSIDLQNGPTLVFLDKYNSISRLETHLNAPVVHHSWKFVGQLSWEIKGKCPRRASRKNCSFDRPI
jgi:hypothetical protein